MTRLNNTHLSIWSKMNVLTKNQNIFFTEIPTLRANKDKIYKHQRYRAFPTSHLDRTNKYKNLLSQILKRNAVSNKVEF